MKAEAFAAAGVAGTATVLEHLFGVPVAVFAGCLGGLILALVRLEAGSKFASWYSIGAHYLGSIYATSGMLAIIHQLTWKWLLAIPAGVIGFCVGWALLYVLPGITSIVSKAPELLWGKWFNKGTDGGTDGR